MTEHGRSARPRHETRALTRALYRRHLRRTKRSARRRAAARLGLWLALSVGVHAGLLRLGPLPPPEMRVVAGSELSVSLSLREAPVPESAAHEGSGNGTAHEPRAVPRAKGQTQRPPAPTARAHPAPRAAFEAHAAPAASAPPSRAREAQSPPAEAVTAAPSSSTTGRNTASASAPGKAATGGTSAVAAARPAPAPAAGPSREAARARVRELLLADLARHFEYPWIARRRGWEGRVWLSVTVRPDGALERIHVTRSSGYEVLDRSAVETMKRIGPLAHAAHWLDGAALELPLA